jgi:bifunctional non-homologous end joining protein LigD
VQLWSRNGRDWTAELVAIAAALRDLPGDFVIDGEAVAHCKAGLPDFHRLLARDGQASACLYAFDLLHLGREDLRPLELANRRGVLKKLVRKGAPVLIFSKHMDGADGEAMFRQSIASIGTAERWPASGTYGGCSEAARNTGVTSTIESATVLSTHDPGSF